MFKKIKENVHSLSKTYGYKIGLDLPYLVKNSFWLGFRHVFSAAASLAVIAAFARLASQEVYGQYEFILSVLSIVSVISIPGLNSAVLQSAARGFDGDYKKAVRKSFLWSFGGIPLLLSAGGYYFEKGEHAPGIAFMLTAVFFPLLYAPNTWDSFLQGKDRFDISAKYSSIQAGINALATVMVIFLSQGNLLWIILAYLISYSFFNIFYYYKSLGYIENNKQDGEVFSFGYFLTKLNLLGIIATNADRLIVGILLGPANLAVYSIISMVAIRTKDLLKMFIAVLLPKMSRLEIGLIKFCRMHKNKIVYLFLSQFIVSLVFYFLIQQINLFLFSESYAAYYQLSQAFVVTVFFSIPLAFLGYYIQAQKNRFALIVTNPIFYSLKIMMSFVLIWKFGLPGAVYAFNASIVIWFLFSLFGAFYGEKKMAK